MSFASHNKLSELQQMANSPLNIRGVKSSQGPQRNGGRRPNRNDDAAAPQSAKQLNKLPLPPKAPPRRSMLAALADERAAESAARPFAIAEPSVRPFAESPTPAPHRQNLPPLPERNDSRISQLSDLSTAQLAELAEQRRREESSKGASTSSKRRNALPSIPDHSAAQKKHTTPPLEERGDNHPHEAKRGGYRAQSRGDVLAVDVSGGPEYVSEFNKAVRVLKDRLDQKGANAITQHFRTLDADNSGELDQEEFLRAMRMLNLGVSEPVLIDIMKSVDRDGSGSIDYQEFCDSLKFKRISFKALPSTKAGGTRYRTGPDPDAPFGEPMYDQPFGIMVDAKRNLENFDKKMNGKWVRLAESFAKFDTDGNGEVDLQEFKAALSDLKALNLTDWEMEMLFNDADRDKSGAITYAEFSKAFGGGGVNKLRFIPEFLKPKANRRSQNGHPWAWDIQQHRDQREINSKSAHVTNALPVPASEFFRHLEGDEAELAALLHRRQANGGGRKPSRHSHRTNLAF